jgi:hypothetical protein
MCDDKNGVFKKWKYTFIWLVEVIYVITLLTIAEHVDKIVLI